MKVVTMTTLVMCSSRNLQRNCSLCWTQVHRRSVWVRPELSWVVSVCHTAADDMLTLSASHYSRQQADYRLSAYVVSVCCQRMLSAYVVSVCCQHMLSAYVVSVCCQHMLSAYADRCHYFRIIKQLSTILFMFKFKMLSLPKQFRNLTLIKPLVTDPILKVQGAVLLTR